MLRANVEKETPVTSYNWTTGTSGDWGVAGNWTATPSGYPDASDAIVTIGAAGSYTVTISGGESYIADTVTLDDSGAVLNVAGTLDLAGASPALTVTSGAFALYGELIGGTVTAGAGGTLTIENDATLDGVTWQAPLTLADGTNLHVIGGLTVETSAGDTPGTIDMTAGGATLTIADAETLDNVTVAFGSLGGDTLANDSETGTGQTLTLGDAFELTQTGGTNHLGSNYHNGSIVNNGVILVQGGDLIVQNGHFINNLLIDITEGAGTVDLSHTLATNADGAAIFVNAGCELVLGTGFAGHAGSLITVDSGGTLTLTGTVNLSQLMYVMDEGSLLVAGSSTLNLDGLDLASAFPLTHIVVDGTLFNGTVSNNPVLSSGATLDDIIWQGTLTFTANQALNVTGGLTVETATGGSPGSIDMTAGGDNLYVLDSETLNNATLDFGSTGGDAVWNYDSADGASGTLTLGGGFTIEQSGGTDALQTGFGGAIANAGEIDVTGGTLQVDAVTFSNTGSITVAGGYVYIGSTTFTSTGSIQIGNGGTFEILPATSADITYDDPANLILDDPSGYTGTLSGLSTGDTLQLDGENIASAGIAGTTLTVNLMGGGTLTYNTGPGLDGTTFSVGAGTDGDPRDLLTVLCFLPGTLIATPAGETPIERLAVGDRVRTASGAVRPIAWIGQGSVLATRGQRGPATPVIVGKGALGPNVPHHDLRVTKGHSFLLDGVLIPVEFLVNHRSIRWDDRAQEVTLYHVELETHDILLANGAPAESYRDDGNRWLFRNANSGWDQPAKPPCAPVLTGGAVVDAVWQRLLNRAGGPTRLPLTDDAGLALLVDGRRLLPTVRTGTTAVFILDRRPGEVRLVSHSVVPLELGLARDARELGVAVRRIALRKGSQPRIAEAADARLTEGFHDYEAETGIRWTNGDARLPAELFAGLKGEIEVAIHLGGATSYLAEGDLLQAA